jgi:beta-lactamase superfamily II metal-dependent hydrolase
VIDVGQGQSFLYKMHLRMLIDTGGYYDESKFSIGQNVVVPYLKSQGVAQLDRIYFLTWIRIIVERLLLFCSKPESSI